MGLPRSQLAEGEAETREPGLPHEITTRKNHWSPLPTERSWPSLPGIEAAASTPQQLMTVWTVTECDGMEVESVHYSGAACPCVPLASVKATRSGNMDVVAPDQTAQSRT